jgi:hypothetical protein
VTEPLSQFSAQIDPATAETSFNSQDPALQSIAEGLLREEDSIWQGGAIEGPLGSGRTTDSEDWDTRSLISSFQDSPVINTGSINVTAVTWEAPREDEESFRDYAARRAAI